MPKLDDEQNTTERASVRPFSVLLRRRERASRIVSPSQKCCTFSPARFVFWWPLRLVLRPQPRSVFAVAAFCVMAMASFGAELSLRERLRALPFKIAYECYLDDNWEIFLIDADGSHPTNLTKTPKEHEHYPQVSPDGKKICFSVDRGEGRE